MAKVKKQKAKSMSWLLVKLVLATLLVAVLSPPRNRPGAKVIAEKKETRSKSKLRKFIELVIVVVLVTTFTVALEYAGWLRGFERAALDTWLRTRLHIKPHAESNDMVIVGITDKDYKDIFSSKSPLDKGALEELINTIASVNPAVIGVDIDTSDEQFKEMKTENGIPIVWIEDIAKGEEVDSQALRALGGSRAEQLLTGIANLPIDSDGIIRSYTRQIGGRDSFSWVLVRTYCSRALQGSIKMHSQDSHAQLIKRCVEIEDLDNSHEKDGMFALNLLGDRHRFRHVSAREVLDASKGGPRKALDELEGRIVLLGGLFQVARDEYTTPIGRMNGVELMAQATETELQGGGFRPPKEAVMLVLNIGGGVLILMLFISLGPRRGFLLSVLMVILIAPLWSWIAFKSFAYSTYFGLIFFAVLIHQLYEQAHYYQHKLLHKSVSEGVGEIPGS